MRCEAIILSLFLFLTSVIFTSCFPKNPNWNYDKPYQLNQIEIKELEHVIIQLSSTALRKDYLDEMFRQDQKGRELQAQSIQEFGYKSADHKRAISNLDTVDTKNLYRAKYYLQKYGYPELSEFGEFAAYAPLLVFHHKADLEEYKEYFHYFYQAYLKEDISSGQLLLALRRRYSSKFRKDHSYPGTKLDAKKVIEELIVILEFDKTNER